MLQPHTLGRITGAYPHLSTRPSLFSTRRDEVIHVRDVDFPSCDVDSVYIGTGADSRVPVASAPAIPKVPRLSMSSMRAASLVHLTHPAALLRSRRSCASVIATS